MRDLVTGIVTIGTLHCRIKKSCPVCESSAIPGCLLVYTNKITKSVKKCCDKKKSLLFLVFLKIFEKNLIKFF